MISPTPPHLEGRTYCNGARSVNDAADILQSAALAPNKIITTAVTVSAALQTDLEMRQQTQLIADALTKDDKPPVPQWKEGTSPPFARSSLACFACNLLA
jgi:hypothetical protein